MNAGWIAGCERARRPRTSAIAAQGAWEPRLFGNDGALITRRAIYTEPRCGIAFSRRNCSRPDRRRGSKRFPLSFLPSFPSLFPSLPDPRGGEAKIRRDESSLDIFGAEIARPRWNAVGVAVENVYRGHGDGNSCGLFPEMFVVAAFERRGKQRWVDTRRNIEFLLIPSAARSNDWFREFRRLVHRGVSHEN